MQDTMYPETKLKEHGNIQSSFNYFQKFGYRKDVKILDVGCYYGSLINKFYEQGYTDVYGIDVREPAVIEGRKAYKAIADNLFWYKGDVLPFEDDSFDLVLMFDVIEHIPDVQQFLTQEVYRVLKPGGEFLFQTPNKITNIPWEIINNKSFTAYKTYHCSLQTRSSLHRMLQEVPCTPKLGPKFKV